MQTLRKRLATIQAKIPSKPNPEADAAFQEVISYLDSLAQRKAKADWPCQWQLNKVIIDKDAAAKLTHEIATMMDRQAQKAMLAQIVVI